MLWAVASPSVLEADTRQAIADPANVVLVSAASVWEVAIKEALGKVTLPGPLGTALEAAHFGHLVITHEHAMAAGHLPRHHGDPFDRMLIAQALIEGATIVTRDVAFRSYPVQLINA